MQPAERIYRRTDAGHQACSALGAYAVDPKAAYEVMRAWRAYCRDLDQSCSGSGSLRRKLAGLGALMFALGLAGWFATHTALLWR